MEFSPAHLRDADGNEVQHEFVRGIYDHDTHSDEIRFAHLDSDKPVEFARVEGTITVRFPLRIRTAGIEPGGVAPAGLTLTIDGPFVSWIDPEKSLPDAASFTPIEQFRAVDKSGQRLEQNTWRGSSMRGGLTTEKYAYWGEVAQVRLDVVDEWATFDISYSLP